MDTLWPATPPPGPTTPTGASARHGTASAVPPRWTARDVERFGVTAVDALAVLGVSGQAARRLNTKGCSPGAATEAIRLGATWPWLEQLVGGGAIAAATDARALLVLLRSGLEQPEIDDWATLGRLHSAQALFALDVSTEQVRAFPAARPSLRRYREMLQCARACGIRDRDLPLWAAAGVLTLEAPYLDRGAFARWRAFAVHHCGPHLAALAAAAGLTIAEAADLRSQGQMDATSLQMLAALRHGMP